MAMRIGAYLACGGVLVSMSHALAQQKRVLVDAAQYECLLQNKAEYLAAALAAAKDPMMLFLSLCPKVRPTTADMARLSQNSGPRIPVGDDQSVWQILPLRLKELQCILEPGSPAVTLLPASQSTQRLYAIELSNCG